MVEEITDAIEVSSYPNDTLVILRSTAITYLKYGGSIIPGKRSTLLHRVQNPMLLHADVMGTYIVCKSNLTYFGFQNRRSSIPIPTGGSVASRITSSSIHGCQMLMLILEDSTVMLICPTISGSLHIIFTRRMGNPGQGTRTLGGGFIDHTMQGIILGEFWQLIY